MIPILRILHLDDSPRDAELIADKLELGGLDCEIVRAQNRTDFEQALQEDSFDIILCDYNLPDYDGISALRRAREIHPGTPVILISGSLGEDEAVKALQRGATDYLLKQRLERLPAAVERAVLQGKEHAKRIQAEAELRASEERFRTLAEHSDEVFWFFTLQPELITYISPGVEKIWGVPASHFYENPRAWEKSIHPEDQARVHAAFEATIAGRQSKYTEEFRVVRPDRSVCWVLDSRTPIQDDAGQIVSLGGVVRDITERKAAAEQQERAQRMESVGMLAAGIAHDFNNALAPIIMAGALLRPHVSHPSGLRVLDAVDRSAQRGVGLVRQLMSFARGSTGERKLVQARHVLKELEELAQSTFPKSIQIRSLLPYDLWTAQANPTQIHQVFLNLLVNARDAMPEGGELNITATNCPIDEAMATGINGARPGSFLKVEVADTGTGISQAVLARIWEPFFTTKGQGKGTGIGLSTVRGIVHQHEGFMTVQTREGKGTTFSVYLPATRQNDEEETKVEETPVTRGNGELILIADDDEPVRMTVEQILTHHGYRVLLASDGADGIARFALQAEEVRLLITDLQMPILGGAALISALRRMNPDLPVVTMSGADSSHSPDPSDPLNSFLAKPFQSTALLTIVRHMLDAAPAKSTSTPPPPDRY